VAPLDVALDSLHRAQQRVAQAGGALHDRQVEVPVLERVQRREVVLLVLAPLAVDRHQRRLLEGSVGHRIVVRQRRPVQVVHV